MKNTRFLRSPELATSFTEDTFTNPILEDGADPWMIIHEGRTFFTCTTPRHIYLRECTSPVDVSLASPRRIFTPQAPFNKAVWAPEIHRVQGRWVLIYAADDGANENHRLFAAVSRTDSPLGPYEAERRLAFAPAYDRWAIDGTYIVLPDGELYLFWSGWPGKRNGLQNIYAVRMSDAWTPVGNPHIIATPEYPWEGWINEGPQILQRDGHVHLVYSANSSWTDDYCLGLATFRGGDPLQQSSWKKHGKPVFRSRVSPREADAVHGPGHASFVTTPSGNEDWIIFHAAKRRGSGWKRRVMAQRFHWSEDGLPVFGDPLGPSVLQFRPECHSYLERRIRQ